jgi:hypothetical protein
MYETNINILTLVVITFSDNNDIFVSATKNIKIL